MAFQLVKHKMAGGRHLFEILYGRDFTTEELSEQPIREISAQCLIYDNEIEKEYIRQQEEKSKSKGGGLILGSRDVNELLFQAKFPDEFDAVVTLLTLKEYEEEVAKPTDNDRDISRENT